MEIYALMAYNPADGSGLPQLRSLHRTVEGAKEAVDFDGGVPWRYYEKLGIWSNGYFTITRPYELKD